MILDEADLPETCPNIASADAADAARLSLVVRRLEQDQLMSMTVRTVLFSAMVWLFVLPAGADRPATEAYQPTKLEWAALELQVSYGATVMTRESPFRVTFIPWNGEYVLCLLQYTTDYPAAALKIQKDSLREAFSLYRESRGWTWLRLHFQEKSIDATWPER